MIIFMVCASSISEGIMFGLLSYLILKVLSGKAREISMMIWIVAALFVIKAVVSIII